MGQGGFHWLPPLWLRWARSSHGYRATVTPAMNRSGCGPSWLDTSVSSAASKAERGYRLFDANSYSLSLPAPSIDAEQPLDDAFAAIMWHLLGSSQRLAEQYRFNGHWRLLLDWVENLAEMRALLSSLGLFAGRLSCGLIWNDA